MDAVVHLAAYQDYLTDFSRFFHVNGCGTALCYELIVRDRLPIRRVVVASSQAVYGEGAVHCRTHGVLMAERRPINLLERRDWEVRCTKCGDAAKSVPTPEATPNPSSPYGVSKLAAERAALLLGGTYNIETVALRYSIVHGEGQSPRNAYSGLLRSVALRLLAGQPPVVFEDGLQLRDFVGIEDVVAANLIALDDPRAPGRAYNVGGGRAWTVLEVVEAVQKIGGTALVPEVSTVYRVGDVRHIVSDISALQTLGWTPRANLEQVWRRYWSWLREAHPNHGTLEAAHAQMAREGVLRRV
jgi:dTDP-L-rhamnose 4-epimerase